MKKMLFILGTILVTLAPLKSGLAEPTSQIERVSWLSWSPAGDLIAVMENDTGPVYLFDTELNFVRTVPGIQTVIWSPDGTRLASVARGGFFIIDPYTGDELLRVPIELTANPAAAWHPTENKLAVALGGTAFVYDLDTGERIQVKQLHPHPHSSSVLLWHPDGRRLISGGDEPTLIVWDTQSDTINVLQNEGWPVVNLSWSPDFTKLVSNDDTDVRILDFDTGIEIDRFSSHTNGITSVNWSNNNLIASISGDQTIIIWNGATGEELEVIQIGRSTRFSWSPDGTSYVYSHRDVNGIQIASAPSVRP